MVNALFVLIFEGFAAGFVHAFTGHFVWLSNVEKNARNECELV